ncbi:hypothetical protein PFISCL1PPCAC_7357, partial [Pristionchus fissidentatus]
WRASGAICYQIDDQSASNIDESGVDLDGGLNAFLLVSFHEDVQVHESDVINGSVDEVLGHNVFGLSCAHLAGLDGGLAVVCYFNKWINAAPLVLASLDEEMAQAILQLYY